MKGKFPEKKLIGFLQSMKMYVDENVCIGCGECAENCPAEVYKTPVENIAEVISPLNCVAGCQSCAKACPVEAISFPPKNELIQQLQELRNKYK